MNSAACEREAFGLKKRSYGLGTTYINKSKIESVLSVVGEGSAKMSASEEMNLSEEIRMPQKKYYRQRAHSNPLSVHALEL